MISEASRWRRRFAEYVAAAYAAEPDAAAVLLGGSAGRGHADRHSDIEIGVFWARPPRAEQLAAICDGLDVDGARREFYEDYGLWDEEFFLGRAADGDERSGVLVELIHLTVDRMRLTIDEVVGGVETDEIKQAQIAAIAHGIPLKGGDLLAELGAAATYPDALATAVVRRWGQIDNYWRWEMWLERDNLWMLGRQLVEVQERVLHMLLAVNRAFSFGFKWLDEVARRLEHAPVDLLARMRRVSALPLGEEPARLLAGLVEETYDLVEERVPDVDVDRLRSVFRWQRPRWDEPPPHPILDAPNATDGWSR